MARTRHASAHSARRVTTRGTDVQARAIGAGVAALVVLVLAGCAGQGESTGTDPTTDAATATSGPLDLEQFTPAPEGAVDEDTGETLEPQPVATWDAASRAGVVEAAQAAMTAFARPGLEFEAWWGELAPLLTQQGQQDYAYVDPANVPATTVTGAGSLVDDTSAYAAGVEVPTDAGVYTLTLTRTDAHGPWLVARFTPPAQEQ